MQELWLKCTKLRHSQRSTALCRVSQIVQHDDFPNGTDVELIYILVDRVH